MSEEPKPRLRGFQFGLGRMLFAIALFATALASYQWLGTMPAGTGNPMLIIPLFLVMPVCACSGIGVLCRQGRVGAVLGLAIGLPLSFFFWMVWEAANC